MCKPIDRSNLEIPSVVRGYSQPVRTLNGLVLDIVILTYLCHPLGVGDTNGDADNPVPIRIRSAIHFTGRTVSGPLPRTAGLRPAAGCSARRGRFISCVSVWPHLRGSQTRGPGMPRPRRGRRGAARKCPRQFGRAATATFTAARSRTGSFPLPGFAPSGQIHFLHFVPRAVPWAILFCAFSAPPPRNEALILE